jgi:hypothetical protein
MKNLIKEILIVLLFAGIIGCETFEPIDENRLDLDFVKQTPAAAEGVLLNAYSGLVNQYSFSEAATDDAVNNSLTNNFKRIAQGELNALFNNPASRWNNYQRVFWANRFLEILETGETVWSTDEVANKLFKDRLKGEALALRALHHFYVLQAHAGVGANALLGVPYYTEYIGSDGDFNIARLSFEDTVDAIMKDFNDAMELLPTDYTNDTSNLDERYADIDVNIYKRVNGSQYNLRISGRIVKALKARLALFAASPSFLNGQGYYEIAANEAAEIINLNGGVTSLSPKGIEFYVNENVTDDPQEMLWRGSVGGNNATVEKRMFPPSVNGRGEINPTHNFVMAFPMIDGTPATAANGFDSQNPYANRDPRLDKYVVLNGTSFGGGVINSGVGGGIDRLDSIPQFSTTTGYYLKKLLQPDVRINSDNTETGKAHANVYFRYTELFLILAEAANEISGPDHKVNGISARDVMSEIRKRAGITTDNYLGTINTKEDMRELIRNERRIELSFEGHRFWDLRRWGQNLNVAAKGYFFNGTEYLEIPVEDRNFPDYAIYMPIPNSEILKFSALQQNNGW